jgi:L,D-peptidoglycan transpeptidase YkuD (ErfK/YbiS/YcfS/YnhG family)
MAVMNIIVQTSAETTTRAILICGDEKFDCALGRSGVTHDKTEGDGKTPVGTYPLRQVFYRADRVGRPETRLDVAALTPETGWCEDPAHPDYNKQVTLPHNSRVDKMTRDDHVYDITVVIGYNDDPPKAGKGSAIFMHVARLGYTPTEGCVALSEEDLRKVLKKVDKTSHITILPPPRS